MQTEDEAVGGLKRPQYARMAGVLKEPLRSSLGSFCLTLFLFNVAISFLVTAALTPALLAPDSLVAVVLSLVFFFLMLVVIFTVCYGITAKAQATLLGKRSSRLVFSGFAGTRGVVHSSIFFALLTIICLALAAFVAFLLRDKVTQCLDPFVAEFIPQELLGDGSFDGAFDEQTIQLASELFAQAAFCAVCFAVLFALAFVPLAFVWCCLIENRHFSLAEAIKQSTRIVRGRYWHCLAFPFYTSWKNIALLALFVVLKMLPVIPAVLLLLGFCAFIQYYTILSKFCFCVPLYFYSFLSVNGFITKVKPSESAQLESSAPSAAIPPSIEEDAAQSGTLAPEAGGDEGEETQSSAGAQSGDEEEAGGA